MERSAPTEAAAEVDLVDFALLGRQTGRRQGRRERGLAVLRRHPDLALVSRVLRRRVHRLHRGVIQERIGVHRLDFLGGAGDRGLHVPDLRAHERLIGIEPALQRLGDRGARHLRVRAFVPRDRERVERGLGLPPRIGHDRDGRLADLHDVANARHALDLVGLEALHLAAEDRALLDRGVEHPGQLEVGAVDLGAGHLVDRVQALDRLADDLPFLRILERHVGRRGQLGGGFRHLAVGGRAAGRLVRDHAVRGAALGRRHLPGIRRGLHQHDAGGGAALADVFVRLANSAAAARREIAPDALARDALARRRILGGDLRPVALELFGRHLGEAGDRALAHLGARDPNDDGVVGTDDDPGVDLGRAVLRAHDARAERDLQTQSQPRTDGGGADDEGAATDLEIFGDHGLSPMPSPRRGSLHGPAGTSRTGRCS